MEARKVQLADALNAVETISKPIANPKEREKTREEREEEREKEGKVEVEACRWEKRRKSFRITVDNASVAGILGGHEKLKIDHLRPLCRGIMDHVDRMMKHGWSLPNWKSEPIEWVPRELNCKADAICNHVMDTRTQYMYRHKNTASILYSKFNLKIATDGGVRGQAVSGTGWVIYAVQTDDRGREGRHVVVMKGGQYYARPMSSLEIEIRALGEAMATLVTYL